MTIKVTKEIYGYWVREQPQHTTCQTLPQVKRYVRSIGEREFDLHLPGSAQRSGKVKRISI